jgi:hypothetical protein
VTYLQSATDYRRAVERIRLLQSVLTTLAKIKGNLDPDVLTVSQEIDEYVVSVQQYWHKHHREEISG